MRKHDVIHKTESRLHNLLHCYHRRSEPRPTATGLVTCRPTENFVKLARMVLRFWANIIYIVHTYRQRDVQTCSSQYFATLPGRERIVLEGISHPIWRAAYQCDPQQLTISCAETHHMICFRTRTSLWQRKVLMLVRTHVHQTERDYARWRTFRQTLTAFLMVNYGCKTTSYSAIFFWGSR